MKAIGIDIGTSGAKGVRVSFPDGAVEKSVRREYPLRAEGNRAEHDPADYVPREMLAEWARKDPVDLFAKRLGELGFATDDEITAIRDEVRKIGIEARKKALSDPMPQPDNEEDRVYAR